MTKINSMTDGGKRRCMVTTMTIRNMDEQIKARLRVRAATHGRSMEDEARDILRAALSAEAVRSVSLVEAIRSRVAPFGGVTLEPPGREAIRDVPEPGA
jgi:plasmid stability protein